MIRLFLCCLLTALAALCQAPRAVETAIYPTGAWAFPLVTEAQRTLYLKGGFNLVAYFESNIEWGVQQNMRFITLGNEMRRGMPPEISPPFESADGTKYTTLGFTQANFNAPAVREWWRKRVPEAAREMKEAGRIAFWKVLNEVGFAPTRPFDYSEGTIAAYRAWLSKRYASLAELNRQWRTSFASFDVIEPPRQDLMNQLANWLEWRRFIGWGFPEYFGSTGDLIRTVVPGAKASANFYPAPPLQGWDHFQIARRTDFVALDLYEIGKWPRLLEYMDLGRSAAHAYNKPFVMLEYHAGPNDWVPEVRGRDIAIEAHTALARESRALMWYIWQPAPAGNEEGIHGLLDTAGKPTERYTVAAETSALTARLAPLLLESRTVSDVAILITEDNGFLEFAQGKRPRARKQPWSNLGHILNAARIQWDFLDTASVADVDLRKYKAVILADLPILSDDVLRRLDAYVQAGGVVITHPDVALRDGVGNPRGSAGFTDESRSNGLWRVRSRTSGAGEVVTSNAGKGKRVSCAWELPGANDTPDEAGKRAVAYVPAELLNRSLAPDRLEERAAAYAGLLASVGVRPVVTTGPVPSSGQVLNSGFLDVRRLQAGNSTLVFLTWVGKGPLRDLPVTVPGLTARGDALLFRRALGSVTRLPAVRVGDGVRITIPEVDPDAIVLLGGPWQPVVGVDAPKTLQPGDTFTATVTVDNLDAQAVSGTATLRTPPGWQAVATSREEFRGLAPGRRVSIAYRVTVPAGTQIDRFALDYPLTAEVEMTGGRTGKLSARHLPFVKPVLDVILTYRDQILNPWQQLTPPLLRWGWTNEVHIPPPPPVTVRATGEAIIEVSNSPALAGQRLDVRVTGPGSATVAAATGGPLVLSDKPQSIPVRFQLSRPGAHQLTVTAGGRSASASFLAGVDEETARAALAQQPLTLPPGWSAVRRFGVAVRETPAVGQPVRSAISLSETQARRAAMFATGPGDATPVAADIKPESVAWATDVPQDGVSTYVLAVAREGVAMPQQLRRVRAESDGDLVHVRGDNYTVTFNRRLAQTESIEIDGKKAFPRPSHWEIESKDGPWTPASSGGTLNIVESPIEVTVELIRPIGPEGLRVREKWVLQARYAAVTISCRNPTKQPIQITRASYRWGLDPAVLSEWRRAVPGGEPVAGRLPEGFPDAPSATLVDWRDAQGRGLLIKIGRTTAVSWGGSGFVSLGTVRHGAQRTEINVLGAARIDPLGGDGAFVEFELWPHHEGSVDPKRPVMAVHGEAIN